MIIPVTAGRPGGIPDMRASWLLPALLLLGASGDPRPALEPRTFAHWLGYLEPRPGELRWQAVDWHLTLAEGVAEARREGMPLLVWIMNGHPAGVC